MIILEENFKWHFEDFASELFIYKIIIHSTHIFWKQLIAIKVK